LKSSADKLKGPIIRLQNNFNFIDIMVLHSHLKRLIEEGEHQQLDFKFEVSDSRKIARSLVAFANTDGGRLLIGVKDNGKIAGVRSEEEYFMVESAAVLYARPQVYFETVEWDVEGKQVLEVIIPKSKQRPHYARQEDGSWLAYVRVDDQNILVNSVLLRVWRREKKDTGTQIRYSDDEQKLLQYLEKENKYISLPEFRRLAKISRRKAETIFVNLIALNVLDVRLTDQGATYFLKRLV
jgi:predicted HTH transcriptional regulator